MKKKKNFSSVACFLVVFVGFSVSCRSTVDADITRSSNSAMRQVVDDLGRSVTIPVDVQRVVSTAPSVTENIFAAGAGDRLVGVTTFCDYPEAAKTITKIGDTMNPNMESIIALRPDIVFVSTASQIEAFMRRLEQNGIAVYVTNPTDLPGVYRNIRSLGEVMATTETAAPAAEHLELRANAVKAALGDELTIGGPLQLDDGRLRTLVQISREPLFTIGGDSFLNGLVADAGGISATSNIPTAYPKLSKETAYSLRPHVIILSESEDNQEPNDAFKNSPAVKNGRVYRINADIISRPGPRLIDALEQIAKFLHPESFRNK